jgi:flagella basal body P-ring formation protein FlgA
MSAMTMYPVVLVTRRTALGVIAVAVALAVAMSAALMVRALSGRQAVVALATNLRQGQRITAADLRVTYIRGASEALPAAALSGLVGQYAITELNDGLLVTRADVSAQPIPVPAGIPTRVLARTGLVPGERLAVTAPGRAPVSAVVYQVGRPAASGLTPVEVLVPPAYASSRLTVAP